MVKVFYLANADAKGAAAFLKAMTKVHEPFIDERTNMVAVRDSPENVRLAERMIGLYDSAEPEVLLEVEIIEIRTSRLTQLGVQFPQSFSLTPLPPVGQTGLTLGNISGLNRDRLALSIGGVTVNLQRTTGDFNTLANPRIRVKSKGKAKILIGDKVPVITTTGVGGFVSDSVNYIDVGLKLDVEPTVYVDDDVAIKIALEVSSLASTLTTASGTTAYQISTRNAETLLRLRDGETQLLAGLISNDARNDASKLPGLGDLPVLGRLFSSQTDNNTRTELVLAITPRVLRNISTTDAAETELMVGTDAAPKLQTPPFPHSPDGAVPAIKPAVGSSAGQAAPSIQPSGAGSSASVAAYSAADIGADSGAEKFVQAPVALQWEGPPQVKVGEPFVVKLKIHSPTPMRGASLKFGFPPDRLAIASAEEGDFFKQEAAITSFSQHPDPSGQFSAAILRNEATMAYGNGTLVTLKCKALKPGPIELSVAGMTPLTLGEAAPKVTLPAVLKLEAE
jgi:general secretion pathway protein D